MANTMMYLPDTPRWIPVTERLPEAYGRYLVTIEDEGYRSVKPLYYGRTNRKDVFYDSDSEYGDVHYDNVIAWMELPEPFNGRGRMNDDTISRQSALDALERIFDRCEEIEAHLPDGDPDKTGYKMFPDYMTVWKYLHQLPSAERRGMWLDGKCSNCGGHAPIWAVSKGYYKSNYCPYCGVKMDEVEE